MLIFCSVCKNILEDFVTQISATRCGHLFHSICLAENLKKFKYCPLCGSKCSPKKVVQLCLDGHHINSERSNNIFNMQRVLSLQIELDNSNKLIDQLLEQISENEKKLDGSKKAIKITLDANQRCLKTNSVLMRELEEVKMLNSYSFSKSCIDLNRPENYRHSVQATAPTWDDLN